MRNHLENPVIKMQHTEMDTIKKKMTAYDSTFPMQSNSHKGFIMKTYSWHWKVKISNLPMNLIMSTPTSRLQVLETS